MTSTIHALDEYLALNAQIAELRQQAAPKLAAVLATLVRATHPGAIGVRLDQETYDSGLSLDTVILADGSGVDPDEDLDDQWRSGLAYDALELWGAPDTDRSPHARVLVGLDPLIVRAPRFTSPGYTPEAMRQIR